jgi:hypothetical protein
MRLAQLWQEVGGPLANVRGAQSQSPPEGVKVGWQVVQRALEVHWLQ